MYGIHDLTLFIVAGMLLNVTPGPDTLYIAGRSTAQGARAGAAAALGVGAGCVIHTTAAALGLSALLAASAAAFAVVKTIGAAYLVYLGLAMLLSASSWTPQTRRAYRAAVPLRRVFIQGCLTNALNPKVALFFLAFLPQFVDPSTSHRILAFMFLGAVFNLTGTCWNLAVAAFAARVTRDAGGRPVVWFNRGIGVLLSGSGRACCFCAAPRQREGAPLRRALRVTQLTGMLRRFAFSTLGREISSTPLSMLARALSPFTEAGRATVRLKAPRVISLR